MNEDELFDLWEEDNAHYGYQESGISIYSLPPLAAVLMSFVLAVIMINFASNQLNSVDVSVLSIQDFTSAEEPETAVAQIAAPTIKKHGIAPFFSASVQYWSADIVKWAAEWELDPNLVATVMQIESCGHPDVSSSAGAIGLFQVMPYHFVRGENAKNPDTNAYRGLSYLSRSLEAHNGDVYYALAGYNAGIAGSQRGESKWPAETLRYTYWGIGIYQDAAAGLSSSERFAEWFDKGSGLCTRAEERLGIGP